MKRGTWYFDFLSPYAYFHARQLKRLNGMLELDPKPVLLAALLNHWGQKGPAEIVPKRLFMCRQLYWLARERNIEFRMPATHPFNPLPYLRLAIAQGCDATVIELIFSELFTTGADPAAPELLQRIFSRLQIENPMDAIHAPWVKETLRQNTDAAITQGVFGVPTIVVDGYTFWGEDSLPMLRAYLEEPRIFDAEEIRRAYAVKPSARR